MLHRRSDVDEVLKEFDGQTLINLIVLSQFKSDAHEIQAEEPHPTGGVGLFQNSPSRQALAAVNDCDVIEPKKTAFENIIALAVDFVYPPSKVDEKFVETFLQEVLIPNSVSFQVAVVNTPYSPSVHRRV